MGPVTKLTLRPHDGSPELALPYNPESLQVSAKARYVSVPNPEGKPTRQYLGGATRSVSVQVRLDARQAKSTVWDTVQLLFSWLQASPGSETANAPMPPLLSLSWGRQQWFDCCLTSASARYTMFSPDGTPLRAEADIALDEVEVPVKRQNPTSGSLVGRRSYRVVAGDSLQSISYAEYGDPTRWRDVARANDLDDPMALRPGVRLYLPDLADLEPRP